MNRRHLYWLAACLFLLGTGLFLYKGLMLKFPLVADTTTPVWDVEVRVHFKPAEGPVKLRLYVPSGDKNNSVTDEQFISVGFGLGIRRREGNRQATWSIRKAKGEQFIFYKGTVRPRVEPYTLVGKPSTLVPVPYGEAQRVAAQAIVAAAKEKSADTETLVREILQRLNTPAGSHDSDLAASLMGKRPGKLRRLEVATQLLNLEQIPARIVNGVKLLDFERRATFVHWLEVYHGNEWNAYDPDTGHQGIPEGYFPWWYGTQSLVQLSGGKVLSSNTAISRNDEPSLVTAMRREKGIHPLLYEFSLLGLPLDTQAVYRVLLTVPMGVLLLVVLRNIVGIKTFGTFMPVLIAMAFRETQLLWGIVLFTLVVGAGLAIRFYLDQLKLLLVPRLAAVLITVIIIMVSISILSQKLGLHRGLSVALFPMVILTMTIERMNIVWEERGAEEALKQGFGSLLVAVLAYMVMNIEIVQYQLFMFPELLLVLLAVTLLLGRYSGYRLLELHRFKVLAKE